MIICPDVTYPPKCIELSARVNVKWLERLRSVFHRGGGGGWERGRRGTVNKARRNSLRELRGNGIAGFCNTRGNATARDQTLRGIIYAEVSEMPGVSRPLNRAARKRGRGRDARSDDALKRVSRKNLLIILHKRREEKQERERERERERCDA